MFIIVGPRGCGKTCLEKRNGWHHLNLNEVSAAILNLNDQERSRFSITTQSLDSVPRTIRDIGRILQYNTQSKIFEYTGSSFNSLPFLNRY